MEWQEVGSSHQRVSFYCVCEEGGKCIPDAQEEKGVAKWPPRCVGKPGERWLTKCINSRHLWRLHRIRKGEFVGAPSFVCITEKPVSRGRKGNQLEIYKIRSLSDIGDERKTENWRLWQEGDLGNLLYSHDRTDVRWRENSWRKKRAEITETGKQT